MKTLSAEKKSLIAKILANPVYTPESGMYRVVEVALSKMSLEGLKGLTLILSLKK